MIYIGNFLHLTNQEEASESERRLGTCPEDVSKHRGQLTIEPPEELLTRWPPGHETRWRVRPARCALKAWCRSGGFLRWISRGPMSERSDRPKSEHSVSSWCQPVRKTSITPGVRHRSASVNVLADCPFPREKRRFWPHERGLKGRAPARHAGGHRFKSCIAQFRDPFTRQYLRRFWPRFSTALDSPSKSS